MFDISFAEIGVVLLLALIILGPKRLPIAARWLGRLIAHSQKLFSSAKQQLSTAVDEIESEQADDSVQSNKSSNCDLDQ